MVSNEEKLDVISQLEWWTHCWQMLCQTHSK